MFGEKKERIYKHTHLDQKSADAYKPLFESSFANEFGRYGKRQDIKDERIRFVSEQYANRTRIAQNMGVNPLFEDSQIFANIPQISKLFESVSTPGNMIGMGDVANADASNIHNGGIWSPAYKAGSGDIPSYVFGLQSHLALHCIGFDLMPTISVDTPKIMVSFVDTVYGGGSFDDLETLPSFIEIGAKQFTRAWIKEKNLKRATSKLVITAGTGDAQKAMELLFIVGSTISAALTVEVVSTGIFNDTANTYTANNLVTVKSVVDACNEVAGAKIYLSADLTTGTTISSVVVNYASAVRTNIAEAATNNNTIGGMSRAQHEKGPKHKLNVIAMDKQLEVKGIEIEADTSNIQIKDMAAMGINVIAHLYTGVQNQLVQTLDEIILNHLYQMGVQHAVNTVKSQGINHNLYIASPAKTELDFNTIDCVFNNMLGEDAKAEMSKVVNSMQSAAYENQMTHADRLYSRILLIAEFIGQQNRIAGPDFIVLPGTLAACLKKHATFSACPTANTLSASPELHYSGTIFETISVYKNPRIRFDDPRILLGRRGSDNDPGAKFLAYDLAASRQMLVEGTMAEKIRVWSRFEIADIGFYPELGYFTFICINEYGWA